MGGRDRLVEGRGLGEREVSDARSRALQAELDRQRELGAFRLEFTSDVFAFAEVVAQARETALHPLPALDGAEAMAALKARGTALEAVMTTPSEGTDLGVLAQVEGLVDEWRRLQRAIALRLRGDFSPCPPQSAEANLDAAELELEPPPLDDGTPERGFLSRTFSMFSGAKKETVPIDAGASPGRTTSLFGAKKSKDDDDGELSVSRSTSMFPRARKMSSGTPNAGA